MMSLFIRLAQDIAVMDFPVMMVNNVMIPFGIEILGRSVYTFHILHHRCGGLYPRKGIAWVVCVVVAMHKNIDVMSLVHVILNDIFIELSFQISPTPELSCQLYCDSHFIIYRKFDFKNLKIKFYSQQTNVSSILLK